MYCIYTAATQPHPQDAPTFSAYNNIENVGVA